MTYHIVYCKVILIIHITRFEFEAYHIDNPDGRSQCCHIEQGVYIIFHHKTAVKSYAQEYCRQLLRFQRKPCEYLNRPLHSNKKHATLISANTVTGQKNTAKTTSTQRSNLTQPYPEMSTVIFIFFGGKKALKVKLQ